MSLPGMSSSLASTVAGGTLKAAAPGLLAGLGGPLGIGLLGISALGSLFGGGPSFSKQKAYPMVDPRESLTNALESTFGMGQGLKAKLARPVSLKTPIPKPGTPIHLSGLPFTIGAGASQPTQLNDVPGIDIGPDAFRSLSPAMRKMQTQRKAMGF